VQVSFDTEKEKLATKVAKDIFIAFGHLTVEIGFTPD